MSGQDEAKVITLEDLFLSGDFERPLPPSPDPKPDPEDAFLAREFWRSWEVEPPEQHTSPFPPAGGLGLSWPEAPNWRVGITRERAAAAVSGVAAAALALAGFGGGTGLPADWQQPGERADDSAPGDAGHGSGVDVDGISFGREGRPDGGHRRNHGALGGRRGPGRVDDHGRGGRAHTTGGLGTHTTCAFARAGAGSGAGDGDGDGQPALARRDRHDVGRRHRLRDRERGRAGGSGGRSGDRRPRQRGQHGERVGPEHRPDGRVTSMDNGPTTDSAQRCLVNAGSVS